MSTKKIEVVELPNDGRSALADNQMTRLLSEKKLKFTVLLVFKTGKRYEMQMDKPPELAFSTATHTVVLQSQYPAQAPICNWSDVELCQVEENPV